jgi:glycosyltransferase involved in cell wall biosynthesis
VFGEAAWPFYERTLFDLIIVSFIPDLTGLPVGVPVLLNVFGLPPDRATAALERPLLDRCRVITFASQYVAQQFGSLFGIDLQTLRAQVMYAGINQLFYEPTDKKLTQYDVCYVGRIEERKGVRSIIDAITYLKNKGRTVRLVMVGEGSEKMALMEAAAKLGIANQIQWMGAVSPKQVRQVLDQSLIFAYPTLKPEAFGCSNLEAMARSVAVITTNLGGTADYIQPGENAMVCPAGNPQMLGETIAMLLDSPERRESLASKGRSTAEIFSQDKMSRRWLDIVRNALITQPEAV